MWKGFRMSRETNRKNHASAGADLGGPRAAYSALHEGDSRHQKKPALMSRPRVASSKDTTRPTPQNMAMVLRISTSIRLLGNARKRTFARAAIFTTSNL